MDVTGLSWARLTDRQEEDGIQLVGFNGYTVKVVIVASKTITTTAITILYFVVTCQKSDPQKMCLNNRDFLGNAGQRVNASPEPNSDSFYY